MKKKPKKEVKQVVEIHIYVHQLPNVQYPPYVPNQYPPNGGAGGTGTYYTTPPTWTVTKTNC